MTLDDLRVAATVKRDQGFRGWPAPYAQMAVTLEDAEFLHALVRVTKPAIVLELGTGLGISGRFIAEALVENGLGRLYTVEPSLEIAQSPHQVLLGTDLPYLFWGGNEPGREIKPDMVFIDSAVSFRQRDIQRWVTSPFEVLVVVHDANRGYRLDERCGVFLPGTDGLWIGRPG